MSGFVVTDPFGRSPDNDRAHRRTAAHARPRYGTCWICAAEGEVYKHGAVWLCGTHLAQVNGRVDAAVARSVPVPVEVA